MNYQVYNLDLKLKDDPNWNSNNTKLGLVEGQTPQDLNLDLSQFDNNSATMKKSSSRLNESFLNESIDALDNQGPFNVFGSKKIGGQNLNSLRQELLNNYWEFDPRE
jgi:hypothetical protein